MLTSIAKQPMKSIKTSIMPFVIKKRTVGANFIARTQSVVRRIKYVI